MIWLALGLTAETLIFTAAGFVWLRSMGYTFAEAGAGAAAVLFVALSLMHQFSLLVGSPIAAYLLEASALLFIARFARRGMPQLTRTLAAMRAMFRQEPLPAWTITGAWLLMAIMTGLEGLRATGHPIFSAWQISAYVGLGGDEAIPVLNSPALFFHAARFGLAHGACGFGLLAYLAIGLSAYALARRYAWPPMALTVSLMVLSMPRLVHLGLHPSAELVSSAAIAFALVLLYRLVELHQAADLGLFVMCLFFSMNATIMSMALVPVLLLLLVVVMIRRHGWLLCREMIVTRPLLTLLTLVPILALAQLPAVMLNLINGRPMLGDTVAVANNGILEATANLVRYLLISVDPTEPVHRMLVWLVGLDLNRLIPGCYRTLVEPLLAFSGIQAPFQPQFSGNATMGFGPFAVLMVLPAMMHALIGGPRRLKALCIAWVGYLYLACLLVDWSPANLALLSPLLATCGFVVAFSLPPWRLRRRGMRLLQIDFAILLVWSIAASSRLPG
jgi:hypothetical protein